MFKKTDTNEEKLSVIDKPLAGALVDAMGLLAAKKANLELAEAVLRKQLLEHGPGIYEGDFFRASVVESVRETLDMKAVRKKLSPQFIRAHTKETEITTVKVVARIGINVTNA